MSFVLILFCTPFALCVIKYNWEKIHFCCFYTCFFIIIVSIAELIKYPKVLSFKCNYLLMKCICISHYYWLTFSYFFYFSLFHLQLQLHFALK